MCRNRSTLVVLAALAAPVHPGLAQQPADGRHPNIVVFLADDLGWRDTDPYGNPAVRTPSASTA